MITKDELEWLKSQYGECTLGALELTPGGVIERDVRAEIEAMRRQNIEYGERVFEERLEAFRQEMTFKSMKGHVRAQFDVAQDKIPHMDEQIAARTSLANAIDFQQEKLNRSSERFRANFQNSKEQEQ